MSGKGALSIVPAGVITGENVIKLFNYAKEHKFAIPAINVTSSSVVNAVLEAARDIKSPIIIQVSQGGAAFFGGKGLANGNQEASIAGSTAAAHYIRSIAPAYGVPVVLHSDHCAQKLLPWFDGMLDADEAYYKEHHEPLFSSHMLDLSEESKEDNIKDYNASLYTQPEDIWEVYSALSKISPNFSIAAGFGNVHGVYKPGNVKLRPELLGKHQKYASDELKGKTGEKPLFLVFHGGSGSSKDEIREAVTNGVIKMNFAYLAGVRDFVLKKKDYLMSQVGNPEGADKPNKKQYDPRVWVREGEKTLVERVKEACQDLGNENRC
ncbi:MAG: Fructose-bisphosphate aldolase 1 [Tremellales sp. Tagirdzhanova-0007]|nr:MAG: Fructose-bisphosphate aldolase 1 [Tremellales sp. Tagirdzhanova-0007]